MRLTRNHRFARLGEFAALRRSDAGRSGKGEVLLFVVLVAFIAGAIWWGLRMPLPPTGPPAQFPDLQAVDGWINGPPEELEGKWVVLDAWATWCGPCVAELPHLAKAHNEFGDEGVVFLGVTEESDRDSVADFVQRIGGFDWPVAYGGQRVWNELGVSGIPALFLFGPDGQLEWSSIGGGSAGKLRDQLEQRVTRAR